MSTLKRSSSNVVFGLMTLLAAYLPASSASAQDKFPSHPIRIVVPYPAGGAGDIIARSVGEIMYKEMGQVVVIDNRPGANGTVGADFVAKSPPDGYTVLVNGVGPMTIIPHISKVGYNALTDFKPLTQAVALTMAWVTRSDFKIKSIQDLIKADKAGARFTVATNGNGGPNHLAVEQFNQMTGTHLTPIPYRGEQPAVTDVLGGQVDMVLTSIVSAGSLIKDGRLVAIATNGLERSRLLPKVPTVNEAGVPGYDNNAWQGFFVPAKTPQAIVDRLQKSITNALRSPQVSTHLLDLGAEVVAGSSDEFAARLRSDDARYAKLVKGLNLKME